MNRNLQYVFAVMAMAVLVGCATVETNSYRTLGTIAVTVDKAMLAWGDYVRAGLATPSDQLRARTVYSQYQVAMKASQRAVNAYKANLADKRELDAALSAVEAVSGQLVTLIKTFTEPKK